MEPQNNTNTPSNSQASQLNGSDGSTWKKMYPKTLQNPPNAQGHRFASRNPVLKDDATKERSASLLIPKNLEEAPPKPTLVSSTSKKEMVDRSGWLQRVQKNNPEIKEMRERVYPIQRASSFGRTYVRDVETKILNPKSDDLLHHNVILQLIMHHLECEGLKGARRLLEKEANIQFIHRPEMTESRLQTILKSVLNDTERVWDLTMDDKFSTSKRNFKDLIEHLSDLDLLQEDFSKEEEEVEDVNIWTENQFNLSRDGKTIKAASLNHLVLQLTESTEQNDSQLLSTFLYTFKTFTTPEKFLQKLIERYNVPDKPQNGMKEEDWKQLKRSIQLKVVGVLKRWITECEEDFMLSDKLKKSLDDFVFLIERGNEKWGVAVRSALDQAHRLKSKGNPAPNPPTPLVSLKTLFSPTLDLFDCEDEEIARQMTLIEFKLYLAIQPKELLGLAWSKPSLRHRSPNVLKMIDRSTKVSNWVASVVLKEERIQKRVRLVQKFIRIAEHLVSMNNFSTSLAVIAGLNSASVHRLTWTWAEVPRSAVASFQDLSQKLSANKNYNLYRELLASANPPCIPYLGTYLTDLTFIEEASEDMHRGLINFAKRKQIYDVIEKIERYQLLGYNYIPIEQILNLLETARISSIIIDEEERHKLSAVVEPRDVKDRSQIK